ncbi:hypothetical protein IFM89_002222 [Coptis chinensis]|uniref:Uncharacterized protein n=1 Tax=Coptis chinensis TaxID=261450 RepID=A0A835ILM7_9MAGN|nr:hypothetical protein IFM89_002222 [Coptis chinensis]
MSGFGRVLWSSRSRKKAMKQISSRSEDTNPPITLDDPTSYDWGGAAYAYLIRSLDKVCRYGTEPGTKTMSAIWQVLEWWSENVGVPAASLVRLVSEDQYKAYWGHVSVGMLLPALRRAVNVDYIGPSGLQDDVHISQPVDATLSYTPYPQREREVNAPDTASNWTVPITLQNGQIIHDHIEPVGRESVPQLPISDQMSRAKMKAMLEDVLHANASKARVISHISNGVYSTPGDVIRAFNDTVGHSSSEDQHTHSQVFETHMTPLGGVYYPQFEPPQTSRRHSNFHGDSGFDGVRSTFQGDSSGMGETREVMSGRSLSLVALVNDKERILEARQKASANRDKLGVGSTFS